MASVHLTFTAPFAQDVHKLVIMESTAPDGIFNVIDETTDIGSYPNYISEYTTNDASSIDNWFSIEWWDEVQAISDPSEPVQGNTTTLTADVVERMKLRDNSINELLAVQEAETAIEDFFGTTDVDPDTVPGKIKTGLALLALSRIYVVQSVTQSSSAVDSFTVGLVQIKRGSASAAQKSQQDLELLMQTAMNMLGIGISRIAQMSPIEIAGGASIMLTDISRLLVAVE